MPILSEVYKAEDQTIQKEFLKVLLLGNSGAGKTQSLITLPGKKLLVDFEDRSSHLRGEPDIDIIKILETNRISTEHTTIDSSKSAWAKAIKLGEELWKRAEQGKLEWDTVMFDSGTRLGRYAMNYILSLGTMSRGKDKSKSEPTPKGIAGSPLFEVHYSPQQTIFSQYLIGMIPLPCHVIFTGHIDKIEDLKNKTIEYYPKVIGKIRTEVSSWFNEVIYAHREQGMFYWHTEQFRKLDFLRSALNKQGKLWKSPLPFDLSRKPAGFELMLKVAEKRSDAIED